MSKMRKEYDPNKVTRRKRKPIIYIICEGKETETLYFKHFSFTELSGGYYTDLIKAQSCRAFGETRKNL